jgi:hypothetical protein
MGYSNNVVGFVFLRCTKDSQDRPTFLGSGFSVGSDNGFFAGRMDLVFSLVSDGFFSDNGSDNNGSVGYGLASQDKDGFSGFRFLVFHWIRIGGSAVRHFRFLSGALHILVHTVEYNVTRTE